MPSCFAVIIVIVIVIAITVIIFITILIIPRLLIYSLNKPYRKNIRGRYRNFSYILDQLLEFTLSTVIESIFFNAVKTLHLT